MNIIGITGTLGAGKGTIVDLLKDEYGFAHYSVRDYLVEVISERGMKNNRDSMTLIANELRANNSPSFITDELYKKAIKNDVNCIIESIRTPGEIESLRAKGQFYLFAVDADSKVRYNRIKIRKSSTDNIDFDTFIANEEREMNTDDPNKQNLAKCISMADFVFDNNGDLTELNTKVREVINSIGK